MRFKEAVLPEIELKEKDGGVLVTIHKEINGGQDGGQDGGQVRTLTVRFKKHPYLCKCNFNYIYRGMVSIAN